MRGPLAHTVDYFPRRLTMAERRGQARGPKMLKSVLRVL
jgi:hypothetical protein